MRQLYILLFLHIGEHVDNFIIHSLQNGNMCLLPAAQGTEDNGLKGSCSPFSKNF